MTALLTVLEDMSVLCDMCWETRCVVVFEMVCVGRGAPKNPRDWLMGQTINSAGF